jgi:hypothetical protein
MLLLNAAADQNAELATPWLFGRYWGMSWEDEESVAKPSMPPADHEVAELVAQSRDTYAEHERTLGPNHRDTLAAGLTLATWERLAGRPEESVRLLDLLLPRCERTFGRGEAEAISARKELALSLVSCGQNERAESLLASTEGATAWGSSPDVEFARDLRETFATIRRLGGRPDEMVEVQEDILDWFDENWATGTLKRSSSAAPIRSKVDPDKLREPFRCGITLRRRPV